VSASSALPMRIGDRIIGPRPCYIIAEAGVNHNGDLSMAHQLVDAAAAVGADAVKFQTWITDLICAPNAASAAYQVEGGDVDQYAMLRQLELPFEWHAELQAHARDVGVDFLSTPDDLTSAEFLVRLGVPALKVGSAELRNLPHLRALAAFGLPMIISTGMAAMEQVTLALQVVRDAGAPAVSVLHCVSAYPAPDDEMNLLSISTMREHLEIPVGLSDHTAGSLAAMLGVGLGMSILEKHLTLDHALPGPDHRASADVAEFASLVDDVRRAEVMLGDGEKRMTASERDTYQAVRRILVYLADIPAEAVLLPSMIRAVRSAVDGLGADATDRFVGRTLRRPVRAFTPVQDADVV